MLHNFFTMTRLVVFILLLVWHQVTFAQISSTLSGIITDKNTHRPIPFAYVQIPDLHHTVQSDSAGYFTFSALPTASYQVQISSVGYRAQSILIPIQGVTHTTIFLDQSDTELAEVIVTGTSNATDIKKTPLSILTINKEYLTTNLSTNVIDGIAKLPGITAVTTGPNISKPYIRGLGYNRILTLFDGVRQEGQQWGDEHGIEIDKYLIDRIEVIKGPASLMYGSDGLAGVINLIPNQPAQYNKISGDLTTEYQNNNGMYGSSLFLTGNKNRIEWGGRVSKRAATNFQNSIDGRVYGTGFNETAANAFLGVHKTWGYSHLNIAYYNNRQEIPDGSRDSLSRQFTKQITEANLFRPIVTTDELTSYTITPLHQRIQHYRVFWKNLFFFKHSRLSLNVGYQRSVRREYSHPEQPYQDIPGLYLQLNTINYDTKYFLPELNHWAIVLGINGMTQQNNATDGTEFVIPSYNLFDWGSFITIKKDFGKIAISGGIRYDIRHFSNQELYVKPNTATGLNQPASGQDTIGLDKLFSIYSKLFSGVSGSIGFTYVPSDSWSYKVNISRGYRAPNISEIASGGVHPGSGFFQIGNENFRPEFSAQIDIGVIYSSKIIHAGSSFFINQVDNYIYNQKLLHPDGSELLTQSGSNFYPTYKYQQGKVVLYGLEANLDFHLIKSLHFENTFSFTNGDNKNYAGSDRTIANRYVPFMPPARYLGELRYDFINHKKWLFNTFVKLQVSHTSDQNRVFMYNNTETRTAGYTVVNLGAGTGFQNNKHKTICSVYVLTNNVFDIAYQDHLSRLKYFEQYTASPTGKLGIFNTGRNLSLKLIFPF